MRFILCFFMCQLSTFLVAQPQNSYQISGSVLTNDKIPLSFVSIVVLKSDSTLITGVISDVKGNFVLDQLPQNNEYILKFSSIAYQTKYLSIQEFKRNMNIGSVYLDPETEQLQAAQVSGKSVIRKSDHQVILPSSSQINHASTGLDLLDQLQLARIYVDPLAQEVKVIGGGTLQLQINGIQVNNQDVQSLQPADIVRIEYYDSPGLRYKDVACVINYITRRKTSGGGLSSNINSSARGLREMLDGSMSARFNHLNSEFGLSLNARSRYVAWTRQNIEHFFYPNTILQRTEIGSPTLFSEQTLRSTFNYNYQQTDKYAFSATVRNQMIQSPNDFLNRISTVYSSDGSAPFHVKDLSNSLNNTPSLDLYFQRNLANKQQLILNVVGTYSNSSDERTYEEQQNNVIITQILSNSEGKKKSLITEGIYEKGLTSGKFTTGIKHSQSATDNRYSGNINTTINLKLSDTYVYSEYQLSSKQLNYIFGVGLSHIYYNQDKSKQTHYVFRPSFKVAYAANKNLNIRYQAYVSSKNPSLADLNNLDQAIDSIQIRRGNPHLNTVRFITQRMQAGFKKGIFGADFQSEYNYDHQPVMDEVILEKQKFIRTKNNQNGFHRINSSLTLKVNPLKDYVNLSITPGFNRYISLGNAYTHTLSNWYCFASLSAHYEKFVFHAQMQTNYDNLYGESMQMGEDFHSFALGYKNKLWTISTGMLIPFTKTYRSKVENWSALAPYVSHVSTNNISRMVYLNLICNINFGRSYQSVNKQLNNSDTDSGMMSGKK